MPKLYRALPICLLFLGAALAADTHAATLTVTSLANAGPGTLRDQVAAANPGDTIVFSVTGTIQLAAPSIAIDKDLTITGPGAGSLTVRGNFVIPGPDFSNLEITSGIVGLSGLTFANGTGNLGSGNESGLGGAILQSGGTVTVTDCLFSANRGTVGGAIYLGAGSLSVANSTFSTNNSGLDGGAIHMAGGSLAVTTTTFSGNIGRFGGGIFSDGGTAVISNSTFSANVARSEAIEGQTGAYFGWGGGVFNTATMTITNSTFSGNVAQGNLETVNAGGGGIRNLGTLSVSNCTITDNYGQFGGGIYTDSPALSVSNSIVAGNRSAGSSNDVYSSFPVSGGFNVVAVDPKLGPLANHGGPTQTHAPLIGSPALDAGDPNFDATNLPYDQRGPGFPRIKNGRLCIGAFEIELNQNLGNIVVNSLDDHDDGIPGPTDCTLREAINYATPGSTITFSVAGTIALTGGELVIAKNLTVQGPTSGAGLTVSGNNASRIFSIHATTNGLVNLSHLTLSGGNGVGSLSPGVGGAINVETASMVTVTSCTLTGNSATAAGAIKNGARLTVTNSTLTGNTATTNAGGAIRSAGELFIFHSTIAGNSAATNAGGIMKGTAAPATFQLFNSIVAGNTATTSAPDINGTVTAGDYNFVGNTSGLTFSGTHYLTGNPQLGALADYGGPTRTMRPLPGSPVLNAGSNALIPNGLTLDQRGFARVDSGTVDLGAVEVDATPPTVTLNQAAAQTDPTISAPVRFTVVFSEPVLNFATGDVTLGGTAGATTAFVTGSGTTYEVAVSGMTRSGTVLASIAAGVAQDLSANPNAASSSADNAVYYYSAEQVQRSGTIQAAEGGGYAVSFLGNPGQEYTIQFASQLMPADWQPLRTQVADASGVVSFVDNPPPGTPRRFYRQLVP